MCILYDRNIRHKQDRDFRLTAINFSWAVIETMIEVHV